MITGWAWEGTAPGAAGCGVSDDEGRARRAAEAWLRANPGAVAVLEAARLADGTATLSAYWAGDGREMRSRRLPDGRITWARAPAAGAAAPERQRTPAPGTLLLLRRAMRRHRMARGLTLKQCATLFGIHFSQVSRIESGTRLPYGALQMSLAFGVPVTEVLAPCPRCGYNPPAGYCCLLCGASEQDLFTCALCGAQAGTGAELGWHAGESHPGREKAA